MANPSNQVAPSHIVHGEKVLQHAHGQGLAETARAGNQRDDVAAVPPFLDKGCLVNVKVFFSIKSPKSCTPMAIFNPIMTSL
jgi:hypothetical protein